MASEKLGAFLAGGPVAGYARDWDREWQWTVLRVPDKVGGASSSSSSLATLGLANGLGMVTINGYAKLTVVLRLVNWARSSTESVVRAREGTRLAKFTTHYSVCCLFVCCKQGV